MVNLNPPKAPEMVVIGDQQFRPEDVERAEARQAAQELITAGAQDPRPIGVVNPAPTENRRRTERELYLDGGGVAVDPASSILSRQEAPDVGPVTDADPLAGVGTPEDGAKPAGRRKAKSDDGAGS
jgi:hypothetical protein